MGLHGGLERTCLHTSEGRRGLCSHFCFLLAHLPEFQHSLEPSGLVLKGVVRTDMQEDRQDWLGAQRGQRRGEEEGGQVLWVQGELLLSTAQRQHGSGRKQRTWQRLLATLLGLGPTTVLRSWAHC